MDKKQHKLLRDQSRIQAGEGDNKQNLCHEKESRRKIYKIKKKKINNKTDLDRWLCYLEYQ